MKSTIVLCALSLLFDSCSENANPQIQSYYFPVSTFATETTYYFVNQNDTTEKSIWIMKSKIFSNDTFLETSIFDSQNRLLETMTEVVKGGNAKIASYVLYYYDQHGNQRSSVCEVLDSVIFKAEQTQSEQVAWKVSFVDSTTMNICELSKKRKLENRVDSQIIFTDLMRFEDLRTRKSYEYTMTSIYQQGKGLVSFTLELPGRGTKDFELISVKH